jgi:hypothetical protein
MSLRISTVVSVVSWLIDTCKELSTRPPNDARQAAPPAPVLDIAEMQVNGMIIRLWHAHAFACHHSKRGLSAALRKELKRQADDLATTPCEDRAAQLRLRRHLKKALTIAADDESTFKAAFLSVYEFLPHLNAVWLQNIVDDCQALSRVHPPTRACHALVRQMAKHLGAKVRRLRR